MVRKIAIILLALSLGLSAEIWVNAIRDPGAELGVDDWETDVKETKEGAGDSVKVSAHDTTRAYYGEYSFLTDTKKDSEINDYSRCYAVCAQTLPVAKAVRDIDSCFWVIDLEDTDDLWLGEFFVLFKSQNEKSIRWAAGHPITTPNDTLYTIEFPVPDSGVWTEYSGDLYDKWVNAAGWSPLDTITEVQLQSWGGWVDGWFGQEVSWDNIELRSIAYYDYAAESINSDAAANEHYTPVATFANEGILDDMDGMAYAEVLDGETRIYIDSQSLSIPTGSSEQGTFKEWTVPHDGFYTLRVYPIIELDEYSEDDTLEMILTGEWIEETPLQTELVRTSYSPTGVLFSFPSGTNGQLSIYDASGREVYTTSIVPGTPELLWSTNEVSSGLYFYRLNSKGLSVTNKLIVLH